MSNPTFIDTNRPSLPHKRRELALQIFIVSLGVFFLAALVGYAIILAKNPARFSNDLFPRIPLLLWVGTALLACGSGSIELALRNVKKQKIDKFQTWIFSAFIFGALFCIFQSMGLIQLFGHHFNNLTPIDQVTGAVQGTYNQSVGPYGMIATLVFVHAAHFLGGLVFLGYVARQSFLGKYDHEYHSGVTLSSLYWRFMDLVWVAMLVVILFVR